MLGHRHGLVVAALPGQDIEARVGEQVLVAVFRQRRADARDLCHGLGEGIGEAVVIGDDVTDREPPARAKDPVKLGERALLVGEGAERALAQRGVEGPIRERERLGVALHEPDAVAQTGRVSRALRLSNRIRGILDSGRDAAELAPGQDRGGAGAGGDVEEPFAGERADQLERTPRRPLAAWVKLAAEEPLDRGARVGDGACPFQVEVDSDLLTCSRYPTEL